MQNKNKYSYIVYPKHFFSAQVFLLIRLARLLLIQKYIIKEVHVLMNYFCRDWSSKVGRHIRWILIKKTNNNNSTLSSTWAWGSIGGVVWPALHSSYRSSMYFAIIRIKLIKLKVKYNKECLSDMSFLNKIRYIWHIALSSCDFLYSLVGNRYFTSYWSSIYCIILCCPCWK